MIAVRHEARGVLLSSIDPWEGNHEWYSLLGFFQHRGYEVGCSPDTAGEGSGLSGVPRLILAGKADRSLRRLRSLLATVGRSEDVVVLGREVSYQPDAFYDAVEGSGAACQGDPHPVVAQILEGNPLPERPLLWDPAEYQCSYLDASWAGTTAYVRYGNGCQRGCLYCPYGCHFQRLLGDDRVRLRPLSSIEAEVDQWVARGKREFRLVADQVLVHPSCRNADLEGVCRAIGTGAPGGVLSFTTTPVDILDNQELLSRCGSWVSLQVFLCLDFLADSLQEKFQLPSRERHLLTALEFLSSLGVGIKPHFLFLNPFMRKASTLRLIELMEGMLPLLLPQGTPSLQLLQSLFCSSVGTDEVIPPEPGLRSEVEDGLPDPASLGLASIMVRILHSPVHWRRFMSASQNRRDWIGRLGSGCREILRAGTDGRFLHATETDRGAEILLRTMEGMRS